MIELEAVVVGAGQAGLAVSHELTRREVAHVVIDRARIGEGWRRRWDSFCLVTPNWTLRLPGFPYDGDAPDGFMPRDAIVAHLERYARSFGAPLREGLGIRSIERMPDGRFVISTEDGTYHAGSLVLATGAYQRPMRPLGAEQLPARLHTIDVTGFSTADALPPGDVLIVGSGQSGCQIAEELHEAGRRVVLSCGRAPWCPRRTAGRDLFWWLCESGFMDAPAETLPPGARLLANPIATGHDGGHDLNFRILASRGVTLAGRFLGVSDGKAQFAADLPETIAWSDAAWARMWSGVYKPLAERHGLDLPEMEMAGPLPLDAGDSLDLAGFGTVLFCGGFRPEFTSWLDWPGAFDPEGFPIQRNGASTIVDGLFFAGLPLQRKRQSPVLLGVGEDAQLTAAAVAERSRQKRSAF